MGVHTHILLLATTLAFVDAYTPIVSLGALQVCLVKNRNVFPLMNREDRFLGIDTQEGKQVYAGVKSLPYIRDTAIRAEEEVLIFFLSDDIHLAFHHLQRFIRDSEQWHVYCQSRQITTKELTGEDALRPLLLKTPP